MTRREARKHAGELRLMYDMVAVAVPTEEDRSLLEALKTQHLALVRVHCERARQDAVQRAHEREWAL